MLSPLELLTQTIKQNPEAVIILSVAPKSRQMSVAFSGGMPIEIICHCAEVLNVVISENIRRDMNMANAAPVPESPFKLHNAPPSTEPT